MQAKDSHELGWETATSVEYHLFIFSIIFLRVRHLAQIAVYIILRTE